MFIIEKFLLYTLHTRYLPEQDSYGSSYKTRKRFSIMYIMQRIIAINMTHETDYALRIHTIKYLRG